jgi:hypothetical protein
MIHRSELLDPFSVTDLPEAARRVVDGAQNVGHGPRNLNTSPHPRGAMQQVVIPSALTACACGGPGADSDISDGRSTLREIFEDIRSELGHEGAVI